MRGVASEHDHAVAVMEWVEIAKGARPALRQLFHIANEGKRSKAAGARLKAEGMRPGVSDYLLPVSRYLMHPDSMGSSVLHYGLWVELKANGKYPTPEQHEFMNDMRDQGYAAYWCMGWEAMVAILTAYLDGKIIPGRDPKPRGTYDLYSMTLK